MRKALATLAVAALGALGAFGPAPATAPAQPVASISCVNASTPGGTKCLTVRRVLLAQGWVCRCLSEGWVPV